MTYIILDKTKKLEHTIIIAYKKMHWPAVHRDWSLSGKMGHMYIQDEYPKDETEIEVKGTFETYKEPGDDTLYCHLVNSEMQVK